MQRASLFPDDKGETINDLCTVPVQNHPATGNLRGAIQYIVSFQIEQDSTHHPGLLSVFGGSTYFWQTGTVLSSVFWPPQHSV